MDAKDKIIQELNKQVEKLQSDCKALKYNFNEEKKSNQDLAERCDRLRKDKAEMLGQKHVLQTQIDEMKRELNQMKDLKKKFNPIKIQKIWKDLECPRAKYKRKMQYKQILDESMKCITECKKAKVILTLGEQDIDLKWTEDEMVLHHEKFGINLPDAIDNSFNDQANAANDQLPTTNSNDYEVFDAECKFTKRHKRTIISAMDHHRISHKAYHAIRKAGKQNWPSINQIKKEKAKMSKELPFTTDAQVHT